MSERERWEEDLGALPREIAPERDLWPGVRQRLELEARTRRLMKRDAVGAQRWAAAAGLAFALAAGGVTLSWLAREHAPATEATKTAQQPPPADSAGTADYDRAIAELEGELEHRQSALRPETVAVVQENLRIIDAAIARSREVLEKDPGRRNVAELLASAYDAKLDLLRQVTEAARAQGANPDQGAKP